MKKYILMIVLMLAVILVFWLAFFGGVDWLYNQVDKRHSIREFTPDKIEPVSDSIFKISASDSIQKIINNQIKIYGDIDEIMAYEIRIKLYEMEKNDEIKEIEILIDSKGGDVQSTFLVCDAIKLSKKPIKIIAKNFALSGAALVLSCGTKGKRFAFKNAQIMLHRPISVGYIFNWRAENFERQAYKMRLGEQVMFNLISQNTGRSVEQIRKDLQKDFYMNCQQAIEYGLIDSVYAED